MSIVEVDAERSYQVILAQNARLQVLDHLGESTRVAVISSVSLRSFADEIVRLVESTGRNALRLEVPDGEPGKVVAVLEYCWNALAQAAFARSDVIISVGGGATSDLAGFVAATFLRGIDIITMPTTILGMVDAAVGGKTGIDLVHGKNLVGAFHEPRAVLADLEVLTTLPEAEVRSGMAEVVKCGFIDDPMILGLVEENPDEACEVTSDRCEELIRRAVQVKARVVATDLREVASRADRVGRERLNYGHTYGHAIEAASGYTMRHGEAVAVGMVYAAELSHRLGFLSGDLLTRHRRILEALRLPTCHGSPWDQVRIIMGRDKKVRGDQLRFVIMEDLAMVRIFEAPEENVLEEVHAKVSSEVA